MPQFTLDISRVIARAATRARCGGGDFLRPQRLLLASGVDEVARALDGCGAVAIDVETSLDDHEAIGLLGIAPMQPWSFDAACLPWGDENVQFFAKNLLGDSRIEKIGHNFAFDQRAFRANGIEPAWPVYDTIQAAARLWPPQPRSKQSAGKGDVRWLALAACVLRACDGVAYWKEPDREETKRLYETTWPDVPAWQHPRLYCALDAYYTAQLWAVERELLKRWGMWELFSGVVAPAGFVLSKLESRGMLLDTKVRDELRAEAEAVIADRTAKVSKFVEGLHEARLKRIEAAIGRLAGEQAEVAAEAQAQVWRAEEAYLGVPHMPGGVDESAGGGPA